MFSEEPCTSEDKLRQNPWKISEHTKMNLLPEHIMENKQFIRYFCLVTIIMIIGIGIGLLHGFITQPTITPLNQTELTMKYTMQVKYVIPHMKEVFPLLAIFNIGVSMLILLFPLYWVWVSWFSKNILSPSSVPMKATVFFLILAVGHNTFFKVYTRYKNFPVPDFISMFFFHGILEMFAYILAGTFSLLCIDAVRKYLQQSENIKTEDICVFLFHRLWRYIIMVIIFVIIAAFVECYISPELVKRSMGAILWQ